MARAVIVGRDRYFADRLLYELDGLFSDIRVAEGGSALPSGDAYFIDLDGGAPKTAAGVPRFTFSRRGDADFPLPFPLGVVRAAVAAAKDRTPRLSLGEDGHTVLADGRAVRLSESEFSLLSLLYRAGGAYVARDTLLAEVFGTAEDPGILNVYIHYLRKKLEAGDEKIIFSSRGDGYRLNEKFCGGGM